MIGASIIEHDMAYHYEQRFPPSEEPSGEGIMRCHIDMSFAHPLPEPLLRSPKLLVVNTDYSSVLFRFHSEPLGLA